jgi:hypothetical protein
MPRSLSQNPVYLIWVGVGFMALIVLFFPEVPHA